LRRLVEEINAKGGEAVYVVADVGREGEVRRIARTASGANVDADA
jgi:hypothetical protein